MQLNPHHHLVALDAFGGDNFVPHQFPCTNHLPLSKRHFHFQSNVCQKETLCHGYTVLRLYMTILQTATRDSPPRLFLVATCNKTGKDRKYMQCTVANSHHLLLLRTAFKFSRLCPAVAMLGADSIDEVVVLGDLFFAFRSHFVQAVAGQAAEAVGPQERCEADAFHDGVMLAAPM